MKRKKERKKEQMAPSTGHKPRQVICVFVSSETSVIDTALTLKT